MQPAPSVGRTGCRIKGQVEANAIVVAMAVQEELPPPLLNHLVSDLLIGATGERIETVNGVQRVDDVDRRLASLDLRDNELGFGPASDGNRRGPASWR